MIRGVRTEAGDNTYCRSRREISITCVMTVALKCKVKVPILFLEIANLIQVEVTYMLETRIFF